MRTHKVLRKKNPLFPNAQKPRPALTGIRVKFILLIALLLSTSLDIFAEFAGYKDYQNTLGRKMSLRTSGSEENYAYFYIKDNEIYVEGRFLEEPPIDVYFSAVTLSEYSKSISTLGGGRFSASLAGKPAEDFGNIVIKFPSGKYLAYRVEYNNGWFFGDNGIAKSNDKLLKEPREIPADVTALYVSRELAPQEAEDTLNEINRLAAEITKGLDGDYEKARALSKWVSENIYYDLDAAAGVITPDTIELGKVLETRRTICAGYANLYAALLESIGLKTLNLKGGVINKDCSYEDLPFITVEHEWTAFLYENEDRWVYTDTVWDSGNVFEKGQFYKRNIGMKYFDISSSALSQDHRIVSVEKRRFFEIPEFLREQEIAYQQNEESAADTIPAEENAPESLNTPEITWAETTLQSPDAAGEAVTQSPPPAPKNNNSGLFAAIYLLSALILITFTLFLKNKLAERKDYDYNRDGEQ